MTDLIDRIGPYLGIAAFLGLAILAFLIIQQAREVRRLREWAGRAPERKEEAADAIAAVAEARGEQAAADDEAPAAEHGRVGSALASVRAAFSRRFAALDRRLPFDPRYLAALLAAVVIAAAVLTSGFGLLGGDDSGSGRGNGKHHGGQSKPDKIEVAVLNATQEQTVGGGEVVGVAGLAGEVATQVVKPAGFKIGAKTDASSGFPQTTIMFEPDFDQDAQDLASAVKDQLGETDVTPMIEEVRDRADGAPLALLVGQDNADFGG